MRRQRGWMCRSGDEPGQFDHTNGEEVDIPQHKVFLLTTRANTNQEPSYFPDERK